MGFLLLAVELWLAWRSRPTVMRALDEAGLGAPDPFRGRTLRLLFPFYLGDRRVRRLGDVRYADGAGRRHLADVYVPTGASRTRRCCCRSTAARGSSATSVSRAAH